MTSLNFLRIALMCVLVVPAFVHAQQQPVRLPGIRVTAAPDLPGPRLLVGVVRDTNGFAIDGAEVLIPDLKRRTYTKEDGTFRFEGLKRGAYRVHARKLGFAPQVRELRVESDGGTGSFELLPYPYSLPVVVVSVQRGGLSGTVADTGYSAVPQAEVTVLSKYMRAETDSLGQFFIDAPPGNYMISVKKDGFATRLASVTVPEDSGRNMKIMLLPTRDIPVREAHNIEDLRDRLIGRNKLLTAFYTREDIQKLGITWISEVVRIGGGGQFDDDCNAVVNGGPAFTSLAPLTVDDVESVEIYGGTLSQLASRGNTPRRKLVDSKSFAAKLIPMSNTREAGWENYGKKCGTVYVWLR